ncbi:MAG: M67 family metallopeptidase [Synergistaceae bacterium]|nr:M67 family metallopeptidase [Synergistaceae bacterium]
MSASPEAPKNSRIRIRNSDYEAILNHAKAEFPKEACGLLAGTAGEGVRVVEKVYFTANIDASRRHFSIDPREQLAAVKDMRAKGLTPLGNFHSHPESPARLSEEDIRFARDPAASYLILSLAEDPPVMRAFRVEGGVPSEEEIEIRPNPEENPAE